MPDGFDFLILCTFEVALVISQLLLELPLDFRDPFLKSLFVLNNAAFEPIFE